MLRDAAENLGFILVLFFIQSIKGIFAYTTSDDVVFYFVTWVILSEADNQAFNIQSKKMYTAFHLDVLHRKFLSDTFDKNPMKNIDKTHFVMNMNNGRTLGFGNYKILC